jgi:hypothetical protein
VPDAVHEARSDEPLDEPARMARLGDQQPAELLQREGLRLPDHGQRVGLRDRDPQRRERVVHEALDPARGCLHAERKLEQLVHARERKPTR